MEFSRQEYWSGLSCPPPGNLPNPGIEPRFPTLKVDSLPFEPWEKPKNTGLGSLSLLQGNFPTQELNWSLLQCRQIPYQLSYQGSPIKSNNGKRIVNDLIFLFWRRGREVTCSYSKAHLTILYVNLNCATLVKRIRISLHSISPPLNTDKLELFLSLDNLHALFKLGYSLVCQLPKWLGALEKNQFIS